MKNTSSLLLLLVPFSAIIIGCTTASEPKDAGYAEHSSMYPTCDAIIDRCHPFDVGKGPIHDCHDIGHGATTDQECQAKKDECFRICVADSGVTSDASSDATNDASSDASTE